MTNTLVESLRREVLQITTIKRIVSHIKNCWQKHTLRKKYIKDKFIL